MQNLIAANIMARPVRTIISVLAVGIGVTLMLILGGIVTGTLNDYLGRTMGVGADFILQPSGSSIFYAFSPATLQMRLAQKLQEVRGVGTVAPVLAKFSSSDFGLVFGIDLDSYNRLPGRLHITAGRESLQGDEVIVDEIYAKSHKVGPGSPLTVLSHKFVISGVCRPGAVVRVFVPIATLQEMNGTPDKATIMFIRASEEAKADVVYSELKSAYPELAILRTSDATTLLSETRMPGLKELQFTVVLVSMLLSFMVILLAMYTTIFERTREIGVLKSLGASRSFILGMILRESVIITGLGLVFGVVVSLIIKNVIVSTFPTLQVTMTLGQVFRGGVLALMGGLLGALYPAYKAARMDPVKALSYE
jgi:putative ABC transport system permease protein